MALVAIPTKRRHLHRLGAAALALLSISGAGAFYAHHLARGSSDDLVEDVRWTLPPPPASLTAAIAAPLAASDAPANKALPTPPPAPQDARELNVSAPQAQALLETAPSVAGPAREATPEPVVAEAAQPVAAPKAVAKAPQAKAATKQEPARAAKQSQRQQAKPDGSVTRSASQKPKVQTALRAPVRAKVTELPAAPSITPEPAALPQPAPDKRIPILSNIADGMNAVGNSLSSLVR